MRLLLVRHAATEWNASRRIQGRTDTELSQRGRMQADLLGERLCQYPVKRVYTSPLKRAVETGEAFSNKKGCPLATDDKLTEIDLGAWEGMTFVEIGQAYPQELELWLHKPDKCRVPRGEPIPQVRKRSEEFMRELLEKHPLDCVAVVSHTLPSKLILACALGMPYERLHALHLENTSLTIVDYTKEGTTLMLYNDCRHLEDTWQR